jgi:hypothetical protein
LDCYTELDVEQVEVLETLDSSTCELCAEFDGKVIPITEAEPGVTTPVYHPNCRGCTCPYFDGDYGERAARNPDTGGTYYVPSSMKYHEWKEKFIDGGGKDGIIKTERDSIRIPIESKHPADIVFGGKSLSGPQKRLLSDLSGYGVRMTVKKRLVSMLDLAALTAETGDEFAMFTRKGERLIVRGDNKRTPIGVLDAEELKAKGYRWSGHTHPGFSDIDLIASDGDELILSVFKQKRSAIYNAVGHRKVFEITDDA